MLVLRHELQSCASLGTRRTTPVGCNEQILLDVRLPVLMNLFPRFFLHDKEALRSRPTIFIPFMRMTVAVHPVSKTLVRNTSTVVGSSTPARIRRARDPDCLSITLLLIPCYAESPDSSMPAGPPPIMATLCAHTASDTRQYLGPLRRNCTGPALHDGRVSDSRAAS